MNYSHKIPIELLKISIEIVKYDSSVQNRTIMKKVIKICLLASVLSACGGAKFEKITDFSTLNGDYFVYNIEENGDIGSKNIIYLFGNL